MSTKEKVLFHATICFLVRGEKVLLAKKTRHIGAGKFNGYGGGFKKGESPAENALREIDEEACITIDTESIEQVARVHFHNITEEGEKFICTCEILLITKWSGEPQNTVEMTDPTWFNRTSLPIESMMLADPDWIPLALDPEKGLFEAHAYYGPHQATLTKPTEITFVSGL